MKKTSLLNLVLTASITGYTAKNGAVDLSITPE